MDVGLFLFLSLQNIMMANPDSIPVISPISTVQMNLVLLISLIFRSFSFRFVSFRFFSFLFFSFLFFLSFFLSFLLCIFWLPVRDIPSAIIVSKVTSVSVDPSLIIPTKLTFHSYQETNKLLLQSLRAQSILYFLRKSLLYLNGDRFL